MLCLLGFMHAQQVVQENRQDVFIMVLKMITLGAKVTNQSNRLDATPRSQPINYCPFTASSTRFTIPNTFSSSTLLPTICSPTGNP